MTKGEQLAGTNCPDGDSWSYTSLVQGNMHKTDFDDLKYNFTNSRPNIL